MKTDVHLWSYLAEFFLERQMFLTKSVEKIKTNILYPIIFPRKSCRLWDNVEKYGTARQAADGNITLYIRFACWIPKATNAHTEYLTLTAFPNAPQCCHFRAHCLSFFQYATSRTKRGIWRYYVTWRVMWYWGTQTPIYMVSVPSCRWASYQLRWEHQNRLTKTVKK
jgi:hypothetical protein